MVRSHVELFEAIRRDHRRGVSLRGLSEEAAVLRALVEAIGVRRRGVTLKTGAAGRDKLVLVEDPPEDLAQRVAALMKASR